MHINHIVYFDGICNLCNGAVQFIIKQDKKGIFSFASLQSDFAKRHLMYANGEDISYDSVIYQRGNSFYIKSKAILEILKDLGGWWKLLLVFGLFPKTLLDRIYDYIASHRYRWFGKKEKCLVPTPELKSRFLE